MLNVVIRTGRDKVEGKVEIGLAILNAEHRCCGTRSFVRGSHNLEVLLRRKQVGERDVRGGVAAASHLVRGDEDVLQFHHKVVAAAAYRAGPYSRDDLSEAIPVDIAGGDIRGPTVREIAGKVLGTAEQMKMGQGLLSAPMIHTVRQSLPSGRLFASLALAAGV